jgi:hypothetical protein
MILLFFGCAYDEAKFTADYASSYCAWASDCGYFDSSEACVDAGAPQADTNGCTYDSKEARACVTGLDELACPDGGAFPEVPAACDAVYSCP